MIEDANVQSGKDQTIPELVDDVRAGKLSRRQLMKRLAIMGVSTAGAAAIAAVAAHQLNSHGTKAVPGDNNAQHHIQQHEQHMANQATGNVQQLQHDYSENAIVEDSMYPQPFVGRDAIMARKGAGFAAIPNLKITPTNRIVRDNQLTVEWVATGTQTSDYPGLPATGRSFSIPGVTVVIRQDGKIVRESLYYDMAEVQRQLGGNLR